MYTEINHENSSKQDEVKESFCGACVAIPLAIAGAGAAGAGASGNGGKHKEQKKVLFWVGIVITLMSLFTAIYFLFIKKCKTCVS